MRIGIFGGSFDPIHFGHLILAEQCREQANLDQILFVPCANSPLKQDGAAATDRQRVEMVDLAIGGHESFQRSSIEIERGGVSYTVETLEEIKSGSGDDELFFLMGADALNQFSLWKSPGRILELATPLVVNRPSANGPSQVNFDGLAEFATAERVQEIRQFEIRSPLIDISSSRIREKIAAQQSIRYLTPRAVEKYIQTQKVYQQKVAAC